MYGVLVSAKPVTKVTDRITKKMEYIFLDSFPSIYSQAGNNILCRKYLLFTKTQDLNDIYVFAINNKY